MEVMLGLNFALSSNEKLVYYLKQKMITTINTFDGSTLGDNLIMSHHVDNVSSALIPAEAVENGQSISASCSTAIR